MATTQHHEHGTVREHKIAELHATHEPAVVTGAGAGAGAGAGQLHDQGVVQGQHPGVTGAGHPAGAGLGTGATGATGGVAGAQGTAPTEGQRVSQAVHRM